MSLRRVALCLLAGLSLPVAAAPSPSALAKIAPWVLQHTDGGTQAEYTVVLADQADLSGAAALKTKLEKGRFVYETLYRKAQETQGPILADLQARGVEHRSYYIVNMIWVKGDRALAYDLAERLDVARIDGNPTIRNVLPQAEAGFSAPGPDAPEAGINQVRAPQAWALGYSGQGVVVAGADTGIRWTHGALRPHYRGWDGAAADHNYNWHDAIHAANASCPADSPQPCDDNGHGTHTIGTVAGDDGAANNVGMAPGAKWIGCRNMNAGNGTPTTYIECFEFFLAPYPIGGTPAQGNPALAPDVTNNSWGCPPSEGCVASSLLAAVQAQRAAGIVTEMSAGNSGSSCSTVSDPAAIYDESFTTGALNTGASTIASFSSRGPVTVDGSNRPKPDIVAPGTSTRSCTRTSDTSYGSMSGTSMAGPHVAGGVAVLLSAFPSLSGNVDGIEQRLTDTAVRISSALCSSVAGVYPNNVFGFGRLDMGCAIPARLSGSATICQGGSTNLSVDFAVAPTAGTPASVTWSDGPVQGGIASEPYTRSVAPGATTTYGLASVAINGCAATPGAGSATVTVAGSLSNVNVGVAGSTSIGGASPCLGGTATVTDTDGGVSTHQWGYRTTPGGAITNLAGQTGVSYQLNCTHFPAIGTFYLVETTTPQCGSPMVSNETMVTVNSTPVELQSFQVE